MSRFDELRARGALVLMALVTLAVTAAPWIWFK